MIVTKLQICVQQLWLEPIPWRCSMIETQRHKINRAGCCYLELIFNCFVAYIPIITAVYLFNQSYHVFDPSVFKRKENIRITNIVN